MNCIYADKDFLESFIGNKRIEHTIVRCTRTEEACKEYHDGLCCEYQEPMN